MSGSGSRLDPLNGGNALPVDGQQVRRGRQQLLGAVGDQDDRQARNGQAIDDAHHFPSARGIQALEGFVQNQQLGAANQGAGDQHPAHLAERDRGCRCFQQCFQREIVDNMRQSALLAS